MDDLLKQPGYRLYSPDSPESRELLARHGLTSADVEQALLRHQEATGIRIATILGLNEDGVFGAPGEPAAGHQTMVPLLWLQVLELLGRVPQGSTARFIEDGTVPLSARAPSSLTSRRGDPPGGDLFKALPSSPSVERHRREAHTYQTSRLRGDQP